MTYPLETTPNFEAQRQEADKDSQRKVVPSDHQSMDILENN